MAKKVVASLQAKSKNFTKIIRSIKSPKTGAYTFKEEMSHVDNVKEIFNKK